ncbi:MAG: response regulator transcription factor [Burkholderiales bacterium]|nr:MAG: response regulator transcription factor [Burkholderiales bacterium]
MHILLIEDDAQTAAHIIDGLREQSHSLEQSYDGWDGLFRSTLQSFDAVIIDRMLPGLDGLSAIRKMRAAGMNAPVLILTAMGSIEDRVAGLESGADDYLVKPFSMAELNARLNALGRRPPLREDTAELVVADLALHRLRRTVTRGAETIELKPREFRLLEELMLNANKIVTRAMLLEKVWDFQFDPGTNIVETHMSRIRSKINRDEAPALIHTVRGEGYVIRAP